MLEEKLFDVENSLLDFLDSKKLEIEIKRNEFPISATIKNRQVDTNQISMIENDDKVYNGFIQFIFEDELIMKIEDFKIEDEVLSKIKNKLKKWHYTYLEFFFEEIKESEKGLSYED